MGQEVWFDGGGLFKFFPRPGFSPGHSGLQSRRYGRERCLETELVGHGLFRCLTQACLLEGATAGYRALACIE